MQIHLMFQKVHCMKGLLRVLSFIFAILGRFWYLELSDEQAATA